MYGSTSTLCALSTSHTTAEEWPLPVRIHAPLIVLLPVFTVCVMSLQVGHITSLPSHGLGSLYALCRFPCESLRVVECIRRPAGTPCLYSSPCLYSLAVWLAPQLCLFADNSHQFDVEHGSCCLGCCCCPCRLRTRLMNVAYLVCMTGHEKLLRLYNVDKPDSDPFVFPEAAGKLRCVAWTKSDDLLLTSDLDAPNITCARD